MLFVCGFTFDVTLKMKIIKTAQKYTYILTYTSQIHRKRNDHDTDGDSVSSIMPLELKTGKTVQYGSMKYRAQVCMVWYGMVCCFHPYCRSCCTH